MGDVGGSNNDNPVSNLFWEIIGDGGDATSTSASTSTSTSTPTFSRSSKLLNDRSLKLALRGRGGMSTLTTLISFGARLLGIVASSVLEWASCGSAVPKAVVLLGVGGAAAGAKTGNRLFVGGGAVLGFRAVGEILYNYAYGGEDEDEDEEVVWEEEEEEEEEEAEDEDEEDEDEGREENRIRTSNI